MSLVDIFAAFRWWLAIMSLGIIAFPLAYYLLRALPDRGYAFTKMIGLLVVSFVFWFFGSLGFLDNNIAGIIFGIVVLLGISFWAIRETRKDEELSALKWARVQWKYVLAAELLFGLIFGLWVWVRAQNPAIAATEKPMEFAFLNSLGRSPSFPPVDPWLSGFSISYYYFGYLMSSVIGRLAAVSEPVGFNLALVWLAAGTSLGAFGLVYNLICTGTGAVHRAALTIALVAGIALPLAGNLEILLETLHANGLGSDEIWEWLDVRDLEGPAFQQESPRYLTSQWWWWRSSRVIHEYHLSGVPEEGLEPIAEFPAFSFILGDLHPHVLALPYAFLSLGVALAWWRRRSLLVLDIRFWLSKEDRREQLAKTSTREFSLIIFSALVLGGLSFLNTWDVLIHLFVVFGAVVLVQWRLYKKWKSSILYESATLLLLIVAAAVLLYLPFYIGFRSQAASPFLLPATMLPTRLSHFLIIFGMSLIPVFILLVRLLIESARNRTSLNARPGLTAAVLTGSVVAGLLILMLILGLVLAFSQEGASRVISLAGENQVQLSSLPSADDIAGRIAWAASSVLSLTPKLLLVRLTNPFLILFLVFTIGASLYILIRKMVEQSVAAEDSAPVSSGSLPFALLLILTAALLTLSPEFVYLRDNFGQRLNTIFKFYFQAWVLFGVAALYAIDFLLRHFWRSGLAAAILYGSALLISLLFPIFAIQSREMEYRGPRDAEVRNPSTLDGQAYLSRNDPEENQTIDWLRENVTGVPVILEAVGGQYSAYGRVSASTGLPTLLGWPGHEYQWRGSTPEPAEREQAVKEVYESSDMARVAEILNQYNVSYIIYGPREKNSYQAGGAARFDDYFEVAYRNDSVVIYRWQPQQGQ